MGDCRPLRPHSRSKCINVCPQGLFAHRIHPSLLKNSLYANKLVLYAIRHWQWIIGNQYFRVRNVKVPMLMHHLNTHLKAKLIMFTIVIAIYPCNLLKTNIKGKTNIRFDYIFD